MMRRLRMGSALLVAVMVGATPLLGCAGTLAPNYEPTPPATGAATSGPAPATDADQAMMRGMATMQQDMARAPMTGDPDRDFVAMMLPHHQGAVDMAKIELRDGHDPSLRRLARDIVAAQDREIATMRAWQAAHTP